MGAGLSEVQIYNMAFDLLEEEVATTISDDRAPVRWLNRNFAVERDALLRRIPWNFARERDQLTSDATNPAFEWQRRFVLPADQLRILPFTYFSNTGYHPFSFQIEGNYLLTNLSSPLNIIYIKRITTTGIMDSLFCQALAARLALKMSHWLTGKQSYSEGLRDVYTESLREAIEINEVENNYQLPYDDELLLVRE